MLVQTSHWTCRDPPTRVLSPWRTGHAESTPFSLKELPGRVRLEWVRRVLEWTVVLLRGREPNLRRTRKNLSGTSRIRYCPLKLYSTLIRNLTEWVFGPLRGRVVKSPTHSSVKKESAKDRPLDCRFVSMKTQMCDNKIVTFISCCKPKISIVSITY